MPDLLYEKRDGIATITLNRPERRNAFSPESIIRLAEAWIDYRDDDDMRVAILTGAGDKAFCAGGDLGTLLPLFTGAKKPDGGRDRSGPYDSGRSSAWIWSVPCGRSGGAVRRHLSPTARRATPREGAECTDGGRISGTR